MVHDYQSILSLMHMFLAACAGMTAVGFYRILKVLGCIPWESANIKRSRELKPEMILSSLPQATYMTCMPGNESGNPVLSNLTNLSGTTCTGERKTQGQAHTYPLFE